MKWVKNIFKKKPEKEKEFHVRVVRDCGHNHHYFIVEYYDGLDWVWFHHTNTTTFFEPHFRTLIFKTKEEAIEFGSKFKNINDVENYISEISILLRHSIDEYNKAELEAKRKSDEENITNLI